MLAVAVGVIVDVGGIGVRVIVAVGGIEVDVGAGVAGAPHPTMNKRTNPITVVCCSNFKLFMVDSFGVYT